MLILNGLEALLVNELLLVIYYYRLLGNLFAYWYLDIRSEIGTNILLVLLQYEIELLSERYL